MLTILLVNIFQKIAEIISSSKKTKVFYLNMFLCLLFSYINF